MMPQLDLNIMYKSVVELIELSFLYKLISNLLNIFIETVKI